METVMISADIPFKTLGNKDTDIDGMKAFLVANGGTKSTIPDLWEEVLTSFGYTGDTTLDKYIQWLQTVTGLSTKNQNVLENYAIDNNLYAFALINLPLTSSVGDADFSRASSATYFNGTNTVEVGSNVARFEPEGYLNEKASTNPHNGSDALGGSGYVNVRVSITANDINDSFGNLKMDKIVEDTSTNTHYTRLGTGSSLTASTPHIYSFVAKADERDWVFINIKRRNNTVVTGYFDLTNGVFGSLSGITAQGSKNLGNGYYRIWVRFTEGSSGSSGFVGVGPATGNSGNNYTGDGSSGIHVGEMQIEESDYPTSYIENTGTSSTARSADELSETTTDIPNEFSIVSTVNIPFDGDLMSNNDFRIFSTDDSRGTSNEVGVIGGSSYGFSGSSGGVFTVDKSDFPADTDVKIGFSLAQEGGNIRAIIAVNGAEELNTTVAGTLDHSNNNVAYIGKWGNDTMTSRFRNCKLFGVALSSASLQAQTT